jgi:hypothetical protein
MRRSLYRRWAIVGVVVAGGVLAAERAGLAAAAGVDVWRLPGLERELKEQERAEARLDAEYDAVARRMAVKEALVGELIAGRASLADVTDRFQELNRDQPETMAVLRRVYPSADARETTARNVLGYAWYHPFPSPAARAAALCRLDAEFARLFPAAGAAMPQ